jgi:hypothetical protein
MLYSPVPQPIPVMGFVASLLLSFEALPFQNAANLLELGAYRSLREANLKAPSWASFLFALLCWKSA